MKRKRIAALFLMAALAMGSLAGCGGNGGEEKGSDSTGSASVSGNAEAGDDTKSSAGDDGAEAQGAPERMWSWITMSAGTFRSCAGPETANIMRISATRTGLRRILRPSMWHPSMQWLKI